MTNGVARQRFLADYAKIRAAEGRGSADSAYYRSLPDVEPSTPNAGQWRIRACSFRYFEQRILSPLERQAAKPLSILDLGAGNGWLSHRLARRRHRVVALDIFLDALDGLGALRHYKVPLAGVEAEFDHLPFRARSFDVAVFNSSFHYSSDYSRTLNSVRRCLAPEGLLVIMDTPLYRRREWGERMREERQQFFAQQHGFRSEALSSIEYLDNETLDRLRREFDLRLQIDEPWYGWQWALRPLKAKLQGRRPPSRFVILSGRFGQA